MPSQVVQMDYPVITGVSQNFQQASQALVNIGQVLQVTITMLRTAAFFGVALAASMAQYLEVIKSKVDKLAGLTSEFSSDLARAVNDHRTGQYQAGSYFGEGLN